MEDPSGFLPDLPSRLIRTGRFHKSVEFIGGHCSGDGKTFAGAAPEKFVTDQDITNTLFARWPGVTNATKAKALKLYPAPGTSGSPYATQWDRAWTMAGEVEFTCMSVAFFPVPIPSRRTDKNEIRDTFIAEAYIQAGQTSSYSYVYVLKSKQ